MTDDKPTTQIIIRAAQYPAVAVTFDETRAGIHVWIQTRPESLGGYAQGILLDADQAHVLLSALRASLDGKQELRSGFRAAPANHGGQCFAPSTKPRPSSTHCTPRSTTATNTIDSSAITASPRTSRRTDNTPA